MSIVPWASCGMDTKGTKPHSSPNTKKVSTNGWASVDFGTPSVTAISELVSNIPLTVGAFPFPWYTVTINGFKSYWERLGKRYTVSSCVLLKCFFLVGIWVSLSSKDSIFWSVLGLDPGEKL